MTTVTAGRKHLRVDARDNVTTLLDDERSETYLYDGGSVEIGVPFGHKVATQTISAGDAVIKYGVTIGYASKDIKTGEHVHVHNCS